MKFAGFIMTYERADLLEQTIKKIFEQTTSPEKLLIVDNSESTKTEMMILGLKDPRLFYHRQGYNSGPAGAAKTGLEILAKEGFDWIYWGDDDDPPRTANAFEVLLSIPEKITEKKIGALGLIGNRFNINKAVFTRIPNSELRGMVEVDSIAGNNTLIINGKAALQCEPPDVKLFFGLEELDYCLSLKKGGFKLFVDGDAYYALKQNVNKHLIDMPVSSFDQLSFDIRSKSLWREYYSIRNLIFLLATKYNQYPAAALVVVKSLLKAMISFRRGAKFGLAYSRITVSAISDALTGKMGKKNSPASIKA